MDIRNQPTAANNDLPTTIEHGLSLDSIAAGFSAMLNNGQDPYQPVDTRQTALGEPVAASAPADAGAEITPRSIVEAMLFVGQPQQESLSAQQMASLMRGVHPTEVDDIVRDLNEQYERNRCPYTIESHGAGYRLVLREEFAGVRQRVAGRVREARLSQAAIEVLAMVAYNEALTADDVARIRGRPSGAILAQLVRRQLLKIDRAADKPRTARYSTTGRFLQLFGLESLADLPRSQEIEKR